MHSTSCSCHNIWDMWHWFWYRKHEPVDTSVKVIIVLFKYTEVTLFHFCVCNLNCVQWRCLAVLSSWSCWWSHQYGSVKLHYVLCFRSVHSISLKWKTKISSRLWLGSSWRFWCLLQQWVQMFWLRLSTDSDKLSTSIDSIFYSILVCTCVSHSG